MRASRGSACCRAKAAGKASTAPRDNLIGFGLTFIGAAAMPLFNQPGMPNLLLAHMILFGVLAGVFGLFSSSVMPDICDIDELHSGERREGLFSAVLSFVSKIENSLCILVSSYLVSWSGFKAELGADQAPEVLTNLLWLGFAPKILFSGLALVIACYFPITQKLMEGVHAELAKRRAEKAGT